MTQSAEFFVSEIRAMLSIGDSDNRAIRMGSECPDKARTIAAFFVHGPDVVDPENTEEWLYERYVENSDRKGYDFLSSALRWVTPKAADDLMFVSAGTGNYMVLSAFTKAPDRLGTYKFPVVEKVLGNGWSRDPLYAAVGIDELTTYLGERAIDLEGSLAGCAIRAAIRKGDAQ